jgi:O-antigen/teichoic acid export membrane protein
LYGSRQDEGHDRMNVAATGVPAKTSARKVYTLTRVATVADQLIVAVANFGLVLAIGRAFSVEELASYGIGLSIGLMVQALQRHAITIPLMLQPDGRAVRRSGAIVAEQLIVLAIALLAAAAILFSAHAWGATSYSLLIAGASIVSLIVYVELEFARAFLTKSKQPWLLIVSASYYALASAALAAGALLGWLEYVTLLGLLGAAMLIHAAALAAIGGQFAFWHGLLLLRADARHYGGWATLATATYAGYNHIPLLLLGSLAAPVHAAVFAATRSLMQPLQILLRGLDVADKSGFSESSRDPYGRSALIFTMKLAALYALVAGLFGLAAGLLAEQTITLAYGEKFAGFGFVLIAWIPLYVLLGASMPLESLVYARRSFRSYYLVRGLASVASIVSAYPLIMWSPGLGAIVACGLGWLIAVFGTFVLLLKGNRP